MKYWKSLMQKKQYPKEIISKYNFCFSLKSIKTELVFWTLLFFNKVCFWKHIIRQLSIVLFNKVVFCWVRRKPRAFIFQFQLVNWRLVSIKHCLLSDYFMTSIKLEKSGITICSLETHLESWRNRSNNSHVTQTTLFLLVIYAHSCTNLWHLLARVCVCVCVLYLSGKQYVQLSLDEWKTLEAVSIILWQYYWVVCS